MRIAGHCYDKILATADVDNNSKASTSIPFYGKYRADKARYSIAFKRAWALPIAVQGLVEKSPNKDVALHVARSSSIMAEALVASQLGCFFRRDWATTGVWGILPWMAPQNTQCPLRQALRTKFGALTADEQAQRQRQQRRGALSLMSPQQRVAVRQRTCSYWLSLSEAEKAAYYARKKIRLANESPETRARRLARRRLREGIPEDETAEARSKRHENQNARMARLRSKEKRILDGYEGTEAERQAIIDKKAAADARVENKRATETTDDKQARQDNTRLKNERFKATPAYRISEDKRQEKRRAARAEFKKARQAQSEATKDARAPVNRANDAARKWEARRVARVAREAAPAAAAATAKANFFKPRTKPSAVAGSSSTVAGPSPTIPGPSFAVAFVKASPRTRAPRPAPSAATRILAGEEGTDAGHQTILNKKAASDSRGLQKLKRTRLRMEPTPQFWNGRGAPHGTRYSRTTSPVLRSQPVALVSWSMDLAALFLLSKTTRMHC